MVPFQVVGLSSLTPITMVASTSLPGAVSRCTLPNYGPYVES
ncbi:hypothetical protein FHX81_1230 [Saccharothrix saharensis]|uniref:Uncharacterized protein n=1 Tax=Saccharothrix saharensis TaxID=571190 RepID=A0A543J7Z8_9PSEU|nr:hypothetical protein FHX81_1230 [Saccharothrix saharensis]